MRCTSWDEIDFVTLGWGGNLPGWKFQDDVLTAQEAEAAVAHGLIGRLRQDSVAV